MGIRLQYLLFVVILLSVKVNPANGQQIIFIKYPRLMEKLVNL